MDADIEMVEQLEKKKSKQEKKNGKKKGGAKRVLLAILAVLALVYLGGAFYFHSHFYPNTTVNEKTYGMKTAEDLKDYNVNVGEGYLINVTDRDGDIYTLIGLDFSYTYVDAGEEEKLLAQQNTALWPLELLEDHVYTMNTTFDYDADALQDMILALDFLTSDDYEASQDARLTINSSGEYEITPEVYGNEPIADEVVSAITEAISSGLSECILGDDCYVKPEVTSDDEELNQALTQIQFYCNATITYIIEGSEESLDASEIAAMLVIGDDFSVTVDEDKVASFVQTMASTYNTYGDVRTFTTSLGDDIEIGGGDYGWVIDKSGEKEQILSDLEGGEPVTREPVYEQTAKGTGSNEIGTTYIEIDYTNQHLYYYEEGELKLECDIVSGKISNGNGSPDGIFKIAYKKSPATLVGEDYASDVEYFMVFAYNVGIHDADWRSSFGGTIYQNSGSHGCVNIPADKAEELYGMLEVDTPVVAYYRESVSLTSASSGYSNAYSYTGD